MTAAQILNHIIRIAGAAALVLGLAFWTGRLYGLLDVHMALGAAVVLALWALAILALRRHVARSLAVGAILWGALTLALGPAQTGLLTGDLHWIVRLAHLLLGLGAIALGALLARSLRARTNAARVTAG